MMARAMGGCMILILFMIALGGALLLGLTTGKWDGMIWTLIIGGGIITIFLGSRHDKAR